jgi:hypothetical protein
VLRPRIREGGGARRDGDALGGRGDGVWKPAVLRRRDSVSPGDACSGFFTLAWRYIEEQTLQYRKEHGIASDQLEDTLAAMHADGWRLSAELQRTGIPQMLYEQFTAAVHGKTIYTAELFRSMRVPAAWD